jgi:hypothetical protein
VPDGTQINIEKPGADEKDVADKDKKPDKADSSVKPPANKDKE